ncbi:MAG: phage minor capsid protein [Bacteroidales bacterium]|nr:phage minor capsid protein [Lachnoclostridium sp.]MCM1385297.1 phage minor capsid protein [Lachnoclostridium sp.]MCM1466117.1 phage minor capsid protein [Bacteroidales bacterium]
MLSPDYFTNKEDRLLELYRQLEDFILKDITRRLLSAGEMTATADRLIWKLKQMGESQAEIEKKLQKLSGLTKKELRLLLQDAVLTSWEDDIATLKQVGIELSNPLENAAVIRVMDAEYKKSLGELNNLTRTTMIQAGNDLINMLDEADLRVAAGVQSYSAAVCDILDRYAGRGAYVDYPSGTRRTLESAVRLAVTTSMNQTAAQVTNQYVVEAKTNYVLMSAHLGARVAQKGQPPLADHSGWQGRAFCIRGSEPGYPNLLESTGYDIDPETGIGTVVNLLGAHGYGCRHSHKVWDKRLRNPYVDENGEMKIDTEENRKRYELQQKQRAMERSIRATKRKLIVKEEQIRLVAETDVKDILQKDYDRLSYRMTQQNKAYNDFCKANDLQPQYDRIKVADFGREQTKRSNAGARRYKKEREDKGE